jgi:hypothetical protein
LAEAADEGEADVMEFAGAKERNDGLWVVAKRHIEIAWQRRKRCEQPNSQSRMQRPAEIVPWEPDAQSAGD